MLGQLGQHARIVPGVHHHGDACVVLGGGADHGRPADVDILDAVGERGALRHRRLERIEVDHQQIDRRDAMLLCGRVVLGVAANRQQATVHLGVQCLEAAVHHLGKAGVLRHVLDGKPGVLQRLGGSAG